MNYGSIRDHGVRMADYRLYCLDGDGRIGLADWIEAETDEDAIDEARKLKPDVSRCEIWQRNRLVAALEDDAGSRGHVHPSRQGFTRLRR